MEWPLGKVYHDPGAYCDDDVDGEATLCVMDDNEVNVNVLGTYNVYFTATDYSGNMATDTRTVTIVETLSTALSIAMVCDKNDCNNVNKDVPLRDHLVNLGYDVETFDDGDQSWVPTNYDLVVISESVLSSDAEWLGDTSTAILTLEGANYDELNMGFRGKSGEGGEENINITSNHPIITNAGFAAGQTITVTYDNDHLGFMKSDASYGTESLAKYDGTLNDSKILIADAVPLDGTGKRVFFGAQFFANLNADGIKLFDSALQWVSP